MINLRAIANSAIQQINPNIIGTLLRSTGYTTQPGGKRAPTFATLTGEIQVQAIGAKDLEHMNFLNIQGVMRLVYIWGNWAGVVRADQKGGDILQFPQIPGSEVQDWRVVNVKETWPTWSSVIVVLQSPAS